MHFQGLNLNPPSEIYHTHLIKYKAHYEVPTNLCIYIPPLKWGHLSNILAQLYWSLYRYAGVWHTVMCMHGYVSVHIPFLLPFYLHFPHSIFHFLSLHTNLLSLSIYTDGQSIGTRLARRISSSTDSLKWALTKFNSMARDTLEETAYHLPEKLNWELVTNAEQLTSLEVDSIINSQPQYPQNYQLRLLEHLIWRKEQKKKIHQEISQIADFYTKDTYSWSSTLIV